MIKKRCTFKNLEVNLKKPGRNSKNLKNLEEIQKFFTLYGAQLQKK